MHGSFQLKLSNDVVILRAEGPWNLECAQNYQQEYWHLLKQVEAPCYAELLILSGESLLIPEVYELLKKGLAYALSVGLTNVALVTKDCISQFCTQRQFCEFYQGLDINFEFFNDEEAAYHWLKKQNMHCSYQDVYSQVG